MLSVWDLYYQMCQVIFGENVPELFVGIMLILFVVFIFAVVFWIFKTIFRGFS